MNGNRAEPTRQSLPARPRSDNEFLPAALEILETPLSPIRTSLIWFLCFLTAVTLVWSWIGTFDIVATSQGKIQPVGRVKIIQPEETGRVRSIPVGNGQEVNQGDLLVDLDDTELKAEADMLSISQAALQAGMQRHDKALELASQLLFTDTVMNVAARQISFRNTIPPNIQKREQEVFHADVEELLSALARVAAQLRQKRAEAERLQNMVGAQQALISTLDEHVSIRTTLLQTNSGSRTEAINAKEASQRARADLAEMAGQLVEAQASLEVLKEERESVVRTFVAENARQRTEIARKLDELEQQLKKVAVRLRSMSIRSPVNGTVQASAVTTVGQVVTAGAELMRVVPSETSIEIEAYLPNRDIGFVNPGMPAVIKVEAFPFTRYGVIHGVVSRVATDAIPEPDAQRIEGAAVQAIESFIPIGNAQRIQNLVFPVTVRPNATELLVDGQTVPLKAGMAVSVEIKTGNRRILEYLFSPIAQVASEAMTER